MQHGRKRAEELRDYLKDVKFAAVMVSPRQRAQETCRIAGFGDVAVTDAGLQEWNYGESEGKTTSEMREKYGPAAVPANGPIPADLLGDMWAQEWANIYPLLAPKNADPALTT